MISVSEWVPSYGDPHELSESTQQAQIWEHDCLQAVDCPALDLPLSFVDGVRRGEAVLYFQQYTGLAAAFGVGSVLPGGRFGPSRIERVFARFPEVDLPPQAGGWSWKSLPAPAEMEAEMAVHQAMREAEAKLAAELAQDWVVVDGPLASPLAQGVGYVKTQARSLLEPAQEERLRLLQAGQRSSLFSLGDKQACYVRLAPLPAHGHPYFGLVRLEVFGERQWARQRLHQVAGALPAYAGVAHLDPRAPQNLQPIAALEKDLRRRLGDAGLALRAVRASVGALLLS